MIDRLLLERSHTFCAVLWLQEHNPRCRESPGSQRSDADMTYAE